MAALLMVHREKTYLLDQVTVANSIARSIFPIAHDEIKLVDIPTSSFLAVINLQQ
jgi:hypothetical protein